MPDKRIDKPAVMLLEDGTLLRGKSLGKIGTTTGELSFNTGMTGYQEIFTDPSYFGQILVATASHIGNYGISEEDNESDGAKISGFVCKNYSVMQSRKSANQTLDDYLNEQGVVSIHSVDTRSIVTRIRNKGAMNCVISSEDLSLDKLKAILQAVPSMEGQELASKVTTKNPYEFGDYNAEIRIAVLDFGIKRNILRCLADRKAFLKVFPAKTSFEELMDFQPDAFFLSNGPGDPAPMDYGIEIVKKIQNSGLPVFGICLGHQLLALANNAKTTKMHYGHRGINHPVLNKLTGKCEVTSQNHGFAVDVESLKGCDNLEVTHINLNDNSIEGLRIKGKPIFSVQYHPEANPGPNDSRYLFDEFIQNIQEFKNQNTFL